MNYLGHAVLSFGDAGILTGNLIADHVKGKLALDRYPEEVRKGILLHRRIDMFTDEHPATGRAKLWFREVYGLYSGAVVDSLYDHYLANDAKYFASDAELRAFAEETYRKAEHYKDVFPERFAEYFPYMREQNWLFNYRNLLGMKRSLNGLHRRAKHMAPPEQAYDTFIAHYYELAQCYYELMDDIAQFVKIELSQS